MKRIFILFICVFSFITLTSCNSTELQKPNDNIPSNTDGDNNLNTTSRRNNIDILGIASYKSFDDEVVRKISRNAIRRNPLTIKSFDNIDEIKPYLYISYPYDYIKINSAEKYHFTINESEANEALEPIINNCGLGDLEVVFAEFTTYVLENNKKIPSVGDLLISIRGEKGLFTILSNSGSYLNGESREIFSSHKKLTSTDVNKDFEPPIYSIMFTKKQSGDCSLSFVKKDSIATYSDFDESEKYSFNGNEVQTITREVMYDVLNLVDLPEVTTQVIVKDIDLDKKLIKVESQDSLEVLVIDEYTEMDNDLLSLIKINDTLEITYDDLFNNYEPTYVYVNTIKIVSNEEIK